MTKEAVLEAPPVATQQKPAQAQYWNEHQNEDKSASIWSTLQAFATPTERFIVPSDYPSMIKGSKGTVLWIDPAQLCHADGTALIGEIEVELIELQNQQDLTRSSAQTSAGGQLLESGGAYYINITSNNKNLSMRAPGAVRAQFPRRNTQPMDLFTGTRDNQGIMDWNNPRTILQTQQEDIYYPVALQRFGWYNCDRFYTGTAERTEIKCNITQLEAFTEVMVFLIFKEFNAMVNAIFKDNNISEQDLYKAYRANRLSMGHRGAMMRMMGMMSPNHFYNMPIGANAQFLAVAQQDTQLYACITSEIPIQNNHVQKLELMPVSTWEYNEMLCMI